MSDNLITALANALAPEIDRQKAMRYGMTFKHDLTSVAPSSEIYSHGPNGLLTFPGVDNSIFNAMMGPYSILNRIPATPSLNTDPTYFTITGVGDDTGSEPSDVCDDAPVAGLMKGCLVHSVFGRYERATQQLELNRLGQRVDRADPLDLALVGSPIAPSGVFAGPGGTTAAPGDVLTNEVSRKFWELSVSLFRLLSRQIWTGTPANNSGSYKELTGLETLVNTGYVDAETNQACTAMDSYVRSAGYASVEQNGSVVDEITSMYYILKSKADRAGLSPVRFVLAMRSQMFYELTAVWPCSYLSYRCNLDGTSANRNNIDASDAIRFRDEMRAGKYLLIDGDRVDVIVDDGITELDGNSSGGNFPAGCFASDIFFLPMSVIGGRSTLYLEYFQFDNPSIRSALGQMILARIEGPWMTWPRQTNLCFQWQTKIEPRLVLRTPFLAGRLQNVVICPSQHEPQPFPSDPYFDDSGKETRSGPSYYDIWDS